jgi:hypothetical protein
MVKWVPKSQYKGQAFHAKRVNFVINERFQWRYTRYLVTSVFFATLITGGVTGYFLNQNYEIFNRLAYLHAPDLLPQLEREQVWINTFLFAFVITLIGISLFFGLRMTSRMAGPVMVLKRHLKSLASGMFFQRPSRVRENDEFKDLIETYNYLYFSLQAQIKKDVKVLSKALQQKDSKLVDEALRQLLEEKRSQLNASDASSEPNSGSRHVS